MSQHLRYLFQLHRLMDEAGDAGTVSGGSGGEGEVNLTVDIDKASDAIGADLGLNEGEGTDELLDGSATPPAKKEAAPHADEKPEIKAAREAREKAALATKGQAEAAKAALEIAKKTLTDKKVDFTGKTEAQILELAKAQGVTQAILKALPKAWKQEHKATWEKLPPEAQAYIEQREAEVEEGFKGYAQAAGYAKAVHSVMQPYEALLTAQGVKDHGSAIQAVMNAHYVLSTSAPERKAAFMADLARNYGVDLQAALTAFNAGPTQESAEAKATRTRLEALENERANEKNARLTALKAETAAEIEAFASDPKHPYFKEVAREVALLLADPSVTLESAYEQAIYANPVTRAKELSRLAEEASAKARTESEAAAAAAEKARGIRVRGKEEHRESPDLLGSMEDTMKETLSTIKNRT